jgi:hypothetical protein
MAFTPTPPGRLVPHRGGFGGGSAIESALARLAPVAGPDAGRRSPVTVRTALTAVQLEDCVVPARHRIARMNGAAAVSDLAVLAAIDPASFDDPMERVHYLQRIEKVEGLLAALKMTAVVAIAGQTPSRSSMDEAHVATEVALARRVGPGAAGSSIEVARAIVGTFPDFHDALAAGEITDWHCRELTTATRAVTDEDVLRLVGEKTLRKAKRMTPREFAGEVAKVIARHDRDLESRMVKARGGRRVWAYDLPDGLGFLGLVHDQKTIRTMYATIVADGRSLQLERGGAAAVRAGDDDARADASRADAMAARLLGNVAQDGTVTWDRSTQEVLSLTLVMDLDTLRGEADRFAFLDGAPIPATLARDLAEGAKLWRRAVTDPVTGVLLDYGTEQYLPEPLRRFVMVRDGECGNPVCPRGRLHLEHAIPFPEGPSSAANCRAWCPTCHQLKTAGRLRFTDTQADGSATLITEWGQTFRIPPRPFLHDPADEPPQDDPPNDDPPTPDLPPGTIADDDPPF